MNKAKVMRKAEEGEGLTVAEIKVYQKAVKPEKHVYGLDDCESSRILARRR